MSACEDTLSPLSCADDNQHREGMMNNEQSEMISCEICCKEVPISEATTPEAVDYVAHFCGFECYTKWRQQEEPLSADETGDSV